MWGILFVALDIYSVLHARGKCHCNLVVLDRKRTIGVYVVAVILNVPSWLSGILCYHGYKPALAQQAPLCGGAMKAGLQQQRGGRRDLGAVLIQILSPLFSQNSRLQL